MALIRLAMLCLTLSFGVSPSVAKACSVALAMALDVSSSVDDSEYELQRNGLAAALLAPEVQAVILAERAHLLVYEWSGKRQQTVMVPWTTIATESDLHDFVTKLRGHQRSENEFPTAIGNAIAFGATLLEEQAGCVRQVLDVSGDGSGNAGFPPAAAYKHFPLSHVTVNGLVIEGSDPDVRDYYLNHVIHGLGAFVEVASGFNAYESAMKKKLLRELQVRQFVQR